MTNQPNLPLLRGRYLLRHQLGVGGMGAVYLAEDQHLAGKLVAIKQNTETRPDIQVQFNHEAVLLANLKHPALPAVTDHFIEPGGSQFLVMEYIEGKDLAEILEAYAAPLPEAIVLGWIATAISRYTQGNANCADSANRNGGGCAADAATTPNPVRTGSHCNAMPYRDGFGGRGCTCFLPRHP